MILEHKCLKWLFCLVLIVGALFLYSASLWAAIKDVEVVAEGIGANSELALRDALSKAVGQVVGTSITTNSAMRTETLNAQVERSDGTSATASLEYTQSDSAKIKTKGEVKSYKIINTGRNEDGLYLVKVRAVVVKFVAGPTSNRKRIALFPTKINSAIYNVFGEKSSAEVGDVINKEIERYLVQSRKLAVLTRQDLDSVGAELTLISSTATPSTEKAKIGQLLGADVLLLPEIVEASAEVLPHKIKLTGQFMVSVEGSLTILLRVVDAVTGEMKFSERYSVNASNYTSLDGMAAQVAENAVADLVERIYPLLIVGIDGENVIINSGGSSIREGTLYDVFRLGKKIVDPYTKESLGYSEEWVGRIEITRVSPKMSYARLIEGEVKQLKKDSVCRRYMQRGEASANFAEEQNATGIIRGVKLPFD